MGEARGERLRIRPTILMIDDDPRIREAVRRVLLSRYDVVALRDGDEAVSVAQAVAPAAVILDVGLPGRDGFSVCRELRADAETRHIPILFLTGREGTQDFLRGVDAGADGYLTKPVRAREILDMLESLMEARGSARGGGDEPGPVHRG